MRRQRRKRPTGTVVCLSETLLDRMIQRPRTILNPIRMRRVKDPDAAKAWLASTSRTRSQLLAWLSFGVDSHGA